MQPPPIDPDQIASYVAARAAEDEAIGRKKAFWLHAIWISLLATIAPAASGFTIMAIRMKAIFSTMATPHGKTPDPEKMARQMSEVMVPAMIGLAISSLVFVFLILAVVRFFTLPGKKARMMAQGVGGSPHSFQ